MQLMHRATLGDAEFATSFAWPEHVPKGDGLKFEDLSVAMVGSYTRTVTERDLFTFCEVSGDSNPVHLDPEYAAKTMFKQRIAHGMLSAGYISAVFGMVLPGPGAIYVTQTLNFRAPVFIGDRVIAEARLTELIAPKRRARFDCVCKVGDKVVLEGEAILMVPSRTPRGSA
jgi:3-hydroxybutyryl-CoA dehydratase